MATPESTSYVPPNLSQTETAPPTVKRKKKTRKNRPENAGEPLLQDSSLAQYDALQEEQGQVSPPMPTGENYSIDIQSQEYSEYPEYGISPDHNQSSESLNGYSIKVTPEAELTQLQQQSVATFTSRLHTSTIILLILSIMVLFTDQWYVTQKHSTLSLPKRLQSYAHLLYPL